MTIVYLTCIQQIKLNSTEAYIMFSGADADKCINQSWSSLKFLNQYFAANHVVFYNFLILFIHFFRLYWFLHNVLITQMATISTIRVCNRQMTPEVENESQNSEDSNNKL